MKKLIITGLLALGGMIAQAAAVNWTVNTIQAPEGGVGNVGWLVQIYTTDVTFTYDAAKAGSITSWQDGATVALNASVVRATGTGTQANLTTVSYYAVVYDAATIADAKHYIISDVVSITTSEGGATETANFGAMLGTSLETNKFYNSEWKAVPEPTSGLLLLIGMGALALRRKRA